MPRISIDQLPKVSRSGRVSVHAEQMGELEELLNEENHGAGEALVFDVNKDDLAALVSSLRKVGKGLDRKVKTIFKANDGEGKANPAGKLYVTDNGVFGDEAESAAPIRAAVSAKASRSRK